MFIGTLAGSLLGSTLIGRGVTRTGQEEIIAGQNF